MNCRTIQSRLAEDVSSRFDEAAAIHLRNCPECRCYCDDLLELEELSLSLADQFRVPSGFGHQTVARIGTVKPSRFPFAKLALVCVVLVAVLAGVLSEWEDRSGASQYGAAEEFSTEPLFTQVEFKDEELQFVDVWVEEEEGEEVILRLPSVIEIRQNELHEDFDIHNVSH